MTTGHPNDHPSPHRRRVGLTALLFGLAGGPVAWILQLVTEYSLASRLCDRAGRTAPAIGAPTWTQARPWLLVGDSFCLSLALAALAVALLGWRATQAEKSGGAESALQTGEGRSRFMAAAGMLSAAGFVIAILFNLAEYAFTPGCAGMLS